MMMKMRIITLLIAFMAGVGAAFGAGVVTPVAEPQTIGYYIFHAEDVEALQQEDLLTLEEAQTLALEHLAGATKEGIQEQLVIIGAVITHTAEN
jgi:Na+-transporting methylmalonyl-CoA/oxaloacetate decarboxylase gamma subunit